VEPADPGAKRRLMMAEALHRARLRGSQVSGVVGVAPCEMSLVTVLGFGNEEGWQSCTVLSGGLYCRHVCCTFDQSYPHYFLIVRLGDVSVFSVDGDP